MDELLARTVFETPLQLFATLAVLFVAQAVYALYGFGSGLISLGALAFVFDDVPELVALLLLVSLPTELFVVWRDHLHLRFRESGILLAGIALGTPVGVVLLERGAGSAALIVGLGALLLLLALFLLWEPRAPAEPRSSPGGALVAGGTSGVLAGLFGVGGPPLIVFLRWQGLPKRSFRVTLLTLFLATSALRVPLYLWRGLAGGEALLSAAVVLPACLAGLAVGHRMHASVSERAFRRGVAVLLALLGVGLLFR